MLYKNELNKQPFPTRISTVGGGHNPIEGKGSFLLLRSSSVEPPSHKRQVLGSTPSAATFSTCENRRFRQTLGDQVRPEPIRLTTNHRQEIERPKAVTRTSCIRPENGRPYPQGSGAGDLHCGVTHGNPRRRNFHRSSPTGRGDRFKPGVFVVQIHGAVSFFRYGSTERRPLCMRNYAGLIPATGSISFSPVGGYRG